MFPGFRISKSRETESRLVIVRDGKGREREWWVITNGYSFFLGWQKWFEISGVNCCCSATQSCPTLCNPMDCSVPGFPVLHFLLEFAQTHVHWVSDNYLTISSSAASFSFCLQSFPAWGSFPMSPHPILYLLQQGSSTFCLMWNWCSNNRNIVYK